MAVRDAVYNAQSAAVTAAIRRRIGVMARAIFFSLPAHGHTNPSLPLVRELVDRGDEIVYCSSAAFASRIEAAGARFAPYRSPFLADMRGLPDRMDELAWLLMSTTREVLGDLATFRGERPDYLITDSIAPWGHWVGAALGVPVVTSVVTFAINRHVLAYGLAKGVRPRSAGVLASKIRHLFKAARLGRALRRQFAVKGPGPSPFTYSALNIVYTSRHFQPCAATFDERFQFVGPAIAPRDEPAFPWERLRHAPLVYVSLGTIFNADPGFYRTCFEALRALDVQGIVSVGQQVRLDALGEPPPNVLVMRHVPQLEVLRRAAAFVSHGGMNSVSESLYHGVPVLVVPQMSEQHVVGRRTEELGAGLHLAAGAATAAAIRSLVGRLLAEDGFRQQAAVIKDSFAAAGGVARAADAIHAFTRRAAVV
jgi:MGT family glycosyltransferase